MATVKVKNLKNVQKAVSKNLRIKINRVFSDKNTRTKVGETVVQDIKKQNLGSPSKSTKKWREAYDKLNATDPAYSRNKINVTFTGELLNDLKNNVKGDPVNKQFVIKQSDKRHKKYQGVTKKIGNRPKYSQIQEGLEKLGYSYLNLREQAKNKITKIVREKLFDLLSKG